MSRDRDPLDAEERALADLLAPGTARAGPPPELDAAILASARRALQAGPARRRRRSGRRWPAALGVAASLALAVGIAWQLRPGPDHALQAVSDFPATDAGQADAASPAAAPEATTAANRHAQATAAREAAPPPQDPPPPPGADEPARAPEPAAAPPPEAMPAPSAPSAAASAAVTAIPDITVSDRDDADFVPTPPPVDTAIGRKRIHQDADGRIVPERAGRQALSIPGSASDSRHAAADIRLDEEGLDDEPPATVDSPLARRAWLDRIRELRDAGELDAARESLREYHRRYPDLDLPRDLDGLLSQ